MYWKSCCGLKSKRNARYSIIRPSTLWTVKFREHGSASNIWRELGTSRGTKRSSKREREEREERESQLASTLCQASA